MYKVFHRTWWRKNPSWPNGLEPHAGSKTYIAQVATEEEALEVCLAYNQAHEPGKLSRKAEYERA